LHHEGHALKERISQDIRGKILEGQAEEGGVPDSGYTVAIPVRQGSMSSGKFSHQ